MKRISLLLTSLFISVVVFGQKPADKGVFKQYPAGYYQNYILKGIEQFETQQKTPKVYKRFKIDLSQYKTPKNVSEFKTFWHNPPVSQGNTNTCWCFCTTSFLESEVYRLYKKQVRISEMYTVYWEYVEKAREFVRTRGASAFAEGSEANAVTRMWKMYGAVPLSVYSGLKPGQEFHTHEALYNELNSYLQSIKSQNAWNEADVLATVKSILNYHIGEPPQKFTINGVEFTPLTYLKNELKINPDDYVDVYSIMQQPYWKKVEYEVPDNWWHSAEYHNVPLDIYMKVLKEAIRKGFTISIGGDVSEAGFDAWTQVAVVPTFDIPSEYIDENARQFRFSNQSTTDDHGMHLVGYLEMEGKDWYLFKDSGAGSRNCGKESPNFGYYFVHEDYVKLKMMDFMVHKDAFKEFLSKFVQ